MEIVLLIARLTLAFVFGLAGATKATDLAAARKASISFGIPEKLAVPVGTCLPFVEMLIALALLPTNTAWLGAVCGLGLLLVFAAAIAINLARGQAPDCNCFGQLHSRPVSWSVFARNLVLAALATLLVAQGRTGTGLSAFDWLRDMKAGEIASLALNIIAVSLLAAAAVYFRRIISQQTTLVAKIEAMKKVIDEDYAEPPVERQDAALPLEALPVGALAPRFSLASVSGGLVTLEDLLSYRKMVLLLFVSPNCSPCKAILEAVGGWEHDYRKQLTIALLTKGDLKENQARMSEYGASHLLLQGESGVAAEYEAKWTPAGVIVDRNGRIASELTYGEEAIERLVTLAVRTSDANVAVLSGVNGNGHKPEPEINIEAPQLLVNLAKPDSLVNLGKPAPRFSIPDLEGNAVSSKELLGSDTLLLFWDPKCPFCQAISNDIRRWEENPPKGAPRLVFVSSGDAEDVRAESMRFKSQFLYDSEFDTGPLFGTNLTPSAVLIDKTGRIASAPEKGRANILALTGVRKSAVPAGVNI
jgi:peroxiredoxin